MLMLPRVCRDLLNLGSGDIARIDPADADSFPVHLQHDLGGPFPRHAEELLQHHDYELHRRVVVIEQHDLEHRRRLQLAALRLQYGVVLVLRHAALLRARLAPRKSDKLPSSSFPSYAIGGEGAMRQRAWQQPNMALFHDLARAQQPCPALLTTRGPG